MYGYGNGHLTRWTNKEKLKTGVGNRNFYIVSELFCWKEVWNSKKEKLQHADFSLRNYSKLIFHTENFIFTTTVLFSAYLE